MASQGWMSVLGPPGNAPRFAGYIPHGGRSGKGSDPRLLGGLGGVLGLVGRDLGLVLGRLGVLLGGVGGLLRALGVDLGAGGVGLGGVLLLRGGLDRLGTD